MTVRRRVSDLSDAPSGAGEIPVELTDHSHSCWRDARLFRLWCEENLPAGEAPARSEDVRESYLPSVSWTSRFRSARDRWAVANDVVKAGRWPRADNVRLAGMGSAVPDSHEEGTWLFCDPPVDLPAERARDARTPEEREIARMGCTRERAVGRAVEQARRWAEQLAAAPGRRVR